MAPQASTKPLFLEQFTTWSKIEIVKLKKYPKSFKQIVNDCYQSIEYFMGDFFHTYEIN